MSRPSSPPKTTQRPRCFSTRFARSLYACSDITQPFSHFTPSDSPPGSPSWLAPSPSRCGLPSAGRVTHLLAGPRHSSHFRFFVVYPLRSVRAALPALLIVPVVGLAYYLHIKGQGRHLWLALHRRCVNATLCCHLSLTCKVATLVSLTVRASPSNQVHCRARTR